MHDDAVRNLIARYCTAVATFDEALFRSCWMPDARWIAKGATIEGIERIAKVFVRARSPFPLCIQTPLSTEVRDDGGVVRAITTVHELQWVRDKVAGVELYGVYRDVCVADGATWRFAERAFDELYRGPRLFPGRLAATPVA